jgi:hypothetical protein
MKVILSTTLIWRGYSYHSGDEVDLPDDVALRYIAAGSAEQVPAVETAALQTTPPKGKYDGRIKATRA